MPTGLSCSTEAGIVEVGTHESLMDDGGRYRDMVRLQTEQAGV